MYLQAWLDESEKAANVAEGRFLWKRTGFLLECKKR
jgi:hypothetical protein